MPSFLVYFTIGGDPGYVCLLKRCIESIRESIQADQSSNIDFLILCDETYIQYVQDMNTLIHVTPKNANGVEASMRKTQIFHWPDIQKYEKVLYIDSDVLVVDSLHKLFEFTISQNTLYVVPERNFKNPHKNIFFSLRDYSAEETKFLCDKNIFGFNCGQFMFAPSNAMQMHFENLESMIKSFKGEHFYEQSFMNRYFNLNCNLNYDHMETYVQLSPKNYALEKHKIIYHFMNASCHYTMKLSLMNRYYEQVRQCKGPKEDHIEVLI